MRVFYGKQMAIDNLYGKYEDSFQLLYTFKAEVVNYVLLVVEEYQMLLMFQQDSCLIFLFTIHAFG